MATQATRRLILDGYSLEPATRLLVRDGQSVPLQRRPFQVLLYLIEQRERLVSRAELLELFWDGHDVYDETLTKCVGKIRKALSDQQDRPRFIETRYAEGYRFIGPLEEQWGQIGDGGPAIVEIERTRGVKIVVEEEETHTSLPPSQGFIEGSPAVKRVNIAKRKISGRTRLAAVLCSVITLTAVSAIIIARSRRHAPSQPASVSSIAVLPLKNLTGDAANEYLSDGLSETLINSLSRIEGLKVISRGSVSNFKEGEIDPREIGKKLGVGAVLEGSVDKRNRDVRVQVRLVSTDDGRVLWASDNYERVSEDIFAIQDEIAQGVIAGLKLKLSALAERKVTQRQTNNREAYDAYLMGRYYWNERTIPNALAKAIKSFEEAIQKDPHFALAYSGLADSYVMSFWYTPMSSNEAFIKARQAAEEAVQLDDSLSEAHTSLAAVAMNEWNWKLAEKEYQRAIGLNPNYATAHHWYALYLIGAGKTEQALEEIRRARESDPLSLPINADVGYIFFCARRYDEAISEYKKTLEMNSDFPMALEGLAQTYVKSDKPKEALALIARLPDDSKHSGTVGYIYGAAGERDEAKRVLATVMQRSEREYVSPTSIALIHIGLGDTARAQFWLEKSYREHSPDLPILRMPYFDGVRSDPRFVDLVNRVGQ
jgi:TolB-like protein/DNA-binding winged helix-turn-helix (wHTH) protein/thioredoxin-like negative regulator of GroEL